MKSFGLAALGYLVVLAIGVGIGLSMDEETFTGLGVIALTTVILAPIGAVVGAFIGLKRFGGSSRRHVRWTTIGVLAAVAVGLALVVEAPFQPMVLLFGSAMALIMTSGMRDSTAVPQIHSNVLP